MHKFRFVIVSVLLLACAAMMANGVAVDGIHYVLDESNQTASVTFTGIDAFRYANDYQGALVIPGAIQYNGTRYSVTSIGTDAFRNSSVSSITLPTSVSSVYYDAFYGCSQLDTLHCRRMRHQRLLPRVLLLSP